MQHNSRGQTALNSRWVLPVPGRKWHWAPSLSYFILAQNRDYHHFIFSTSIPHRVCWKFISVFLFSFSVWIPLGLLSSLARNTGHSNASVFPPPCCGVSLGGMEKISSRLTSHRCDATVCVLMCRKTHLNIHVLNKGLPLTKKMKFYSSFYS